MSFGDIEMKTADVISFSRAVTRMADQNFPMETSLSVTFVMEDRSIERFFDCIPNYGELWGALCDALQLDAAAAMSFRIYMDDVLLNNRNTIDLLAEAIESGSSAARSIILKVSQSPYYPYGSPAGGRKQPLRARICPHVFYMLVVLLVAFVLGTRIRSQEERIHFDVARINELSSSLNRQTEAVKGCAAGGGGNQTECLAKVSALTDTLRGRDDRLEKQRGALQDREDRIERQKEQIQQDATKISSLTSSLAAARKRASDVSKCTTMVNGTRTWTCSAGCNCVTL